MVSLQVGLFAQVTLTFIAWHLLHVVWCAISSRPDNVKAQCLCSIFRSLCGCLFYSLHASWANMQSLQLLRCYLPHMVTCIPQPVCFALLQRLCRGRNVEGQCAIEGPVPLVTRPTAVLELLQAPVSSVVASKLTSGAVVGGAVYTWGEGAAGKLGHGSAASLTVPSRVSLCVQLNCATAAGPLFGTANTSCQARVPACAAVLWDRGSGPCCAALSPAGLPACCCFLQAPTCKRPPGDPVYKVMCPVTRVLRGLAPGQPTHTTLEQHAALSPLLLARIA